MSSMLAGIGQILPHASRQQDGMGFGAFAEDRNLPGVAIGLQMPPLESADFGDPPARGIEQTKKHLISALRRKGDHSLDVPFRQDPFRDGVHWLGRPNGPWRQKIAGSQSRVQN